MGGIHSTFKSAECCEFTIKYQMHPYQWTIRMSIPMVWMSLIPNWKPALTFRKVMILRNLNNLTSFNTPKKLKFMFDPEKNRTASASNGIVANKSM